MPEVASSSGAVCALTSFDYDFSAEGGKRGTSWAVWLAPAFDTEPVKVKLPDAVMVTAIEEAGFGGMVVVDYTINAYVKRGAAVMERKASKVTVLDGNALDAFADAD